MSRDTIPTIRNSTGDMNVALSKSWTVNKTLKKAYTGGKIEFALDGNTILCMKDGDVNFLNVQDGLVKRSLQGEVSFLIAKLCTQIHRIYVPSTTYDRK